MWVEVSHSSSRAICLIQCGLCLDTLVERICSIFTAEIPIFLMTIIFLDQIYASSFLDNLSCVFHCCNVRTEFAMQRDTIVVVYCSVAS